TLGLAILGLAVALAVQYQENLDRNAGSETALERHNTLVGAMQRQLDVLTREEQGLRGVADQMDAQLREQKQQAAHLASMSAAAKRANVSSQPFTSIDVVLEFDPSIILNVAFGKPDLL